MLAQPPRPSAARAPRIVAASRVGGASNDRSSTYSTIRITARIAGISISRSCAAATLCWALSAPGRQAPPGADDWKYDVVYQRQGPPLKGLSFAHHWEATNVAALFGFMKAKMPPDRPGQLPDDDYADLIAYILGENGFQPGDKELPPDTKVQEAMGLKK